MTHMFSTKLTAHSQSRYQPSGIVLDWTSDGFGKGFALYLFLVAGFQLNYLYLYFVVGNREPSCQETQSEGCLHVFSRITVVSEPQDVVRIAGLLRGTESAAQAVSYGLQSVQSFGTIGGSALNFGLWGLSLFPAWLVVREIGVTLEGRVEKEKRVVVEILHKVQSNTDEEKITGIESKNSGEKGLP